MAATILAAANARHTAHLRRAVDEEEAHHSRVEPACFPPELRFDLSTGSPDVCLRRYAPGLRRVVAAAVKRKLVLFMPSHSRCTHR